MRLRVSAILLLFFGALLVLNFSLGSYIILAQPEAGRFAPGGELSVDAASPLEVTVVGTGWNQTCMSPCTFDLEGAAGTVTAGNLSRDFYITQGTTRHWQIDAEQPDSTRLAPSKLDAVIPVSLALAGVVSLAGGVRLWRGTDWRLPLLGAGLVGLAGLVLFNLGAIAAGAFGAWAVVKDTPRLKGLESWSGAVPGDEEE